MVLSLGCSTPYRTVVMDPAPIDAWSSAPAHAARICALRPSWVGGALPLIVHDEGELVAALGADSYVCWTAAPGRHRLAVRHHHLHTPTPSVHTEVLLTAGARTYLEVSSGIDGSVDVEWLDEVEALEDMERCSWEELVEAPPGERLHARGHFGAGTRAVSAAGGSTSPR